MYLDFLNEKNAYIAASRRAFACGLAAASGGNISVRLPEPDRMIVKPSGITLGEAAEENLIITDLHGNLVEGTIKPTKETILHGGLYRFLPDIGGIVHVHPIYSIICANTFDQVPLVTKQMKQIMNVPIPVCKIKNNTVDDNGMAMIYDMLERNPGVCCFLLEEHGVVSFAKTVTEAENNAELVEENAKVFWHMHS